jgi:hypothetical protein
LSTTFSGGGLGQDRPAHHAGDDEPGRVDIHGHHFGPGLGRLIQLGHEVLIFKRFQGRDGFAVNLF